MQDESTGAHNATPHTTAETPGRESDRDDNAAATAVEKPGVQIGGSRGSESDADPENTDGVWIPRNDFGRHEVYHTDKNCPHLTRANKSSKVPLKTLFDDAQECSFCKGDGSTNPSGSGEGHYESLVAAAKGGDDA